nr:calmodulin-binding protein 60 D-like isoform X2 [Lolium perenne]
MAPPKRELALKGAGAGASREGLKRLRVAFVAGASAGAAGLPVPPSSPGKCLMRRIVLVVLFFLRMTDCRTTVVESISQIGRMFQRFQKAQTLMLSKFEGKLEKMEGKLEKFGEKMEGISLEVKKLARLLSNRHDDQQPRQEQSATASGSNAKFHLRFLDGLKTPIYTEKSIISESNSAIRIGIFDGDGNMIRDGPLSKVKVEMLVLRGDFCNDGRESWTEEEFNSHVAQGRHGQGFVLGGDCSVWLNNGEASFGGVIRFKEGSSRTRSRKFVVAARVCMDGKPADRVQEAVMKPVTVLDRRNEANEKRHPPELDDEVYRLEEISKDGTYHKRLQNAEIFTVKDLLKALNNDANKLRKDVLQMKKLNNSWEKMVKHARECLLADNHQLIAYFDEVANVVLFFNCVYDLVGAGFNGGYVAQNNFDAAQKALTNELMELARNELDSTPFNYVMNGGLPVPVPSRENSFISMPVLAPDAVLQASEYRRHDRIDHATYGIFSLGDACVHGDQNTASTDYFHGTCEGIPPLGHQQPSTSAVPYWDQSPGLMISSHGNAWDCNPLDWRFAGSSQVNNHSHAQADMSFNGGRALEASTSSQNNLLLQQSFPTQFQESMPRMRYSNDVPNPVDEPSIWQDDLLPEPEPSANPFQGPGY